MAVAVIHEPAGHRFLAHVDGAECVLEYRLSGKTMTITYTGVPARLGGRGIAGELTRFALEVARAEGWKVVPACSYAATYLRKHPEYGDPLA
jgi:predicted GNAT family acetyltransferase